MKKQNIPSRCQDCVNLKAWSLDMSGNHEYTCSNRSPAFKKADEPCGSYVSQQQLEYEMAVDMVEHCNRYEPTYNPEDGSM